MTRNVELGEFLRASRARLSPADVGLDSAVSVTTASGGRRVSGLRREEVARLAGVSADYYAKLEQGRTKQPSTSVLGALATALRLNDTEREYLLTLVQPHVVRGEHGSHTPERVRPGARRLLGTFTNAPAFIMGRGTAILAMNDLAKALFFDLDDRPAALRNLTVWTFLDPEARERYVDWRSVAADNAAILRMDAASSPDDPDIAAIVGMLSMKSDEFQDMWRERRVYECTYGRKQFDHPVVGRMDLDYEALDVPGSPGQSLHVYSAAPGSPSDKALQRLASWAAADASIATIGVADAADRRDAAPSAVPPQEHS